MLLLVSSCAPHRPPPPAEAVGRPLDQVYNQTRREGVQAGAVEVSFAGLDKGGLATVPDFIKSLPIDSRSVIIRSYFNYYAPAHPQAEPNHFSTQLMEHIDDLIKQCAAGGCDSYTDIVTKNSILLK